MGKHIVLGAGNLGLDLEQQARAEGHSVQVFSASNGWRYPDKLPRARLAEADVVWCTVGAGSVEAAAKDFREFADLHIRLPMELAQFLPRSTRLVCFSTEYLECDQARRSLYAQSKLAMEHLLLGSGRENLRIYRVGSLYGSHKISATFPGKLAAKIAKGETLISLPKNACHPTPTAWLAALLMQHIERPPFAKVIRAYSGGAATMLEWAELAFGPPAGFFQREPDPDRPLSLPAGTALGRVEVPSWRELWVMHGRKLRLIP